MINLPKIEVRDLTVDDIKLIVDYWLNAKPDFLMGMGVDLNKLPTRSELTRRLNAQVHLPDSEKSSLAMILTINGKAAGHCNASDIKYGEEAKMHLHLWSSKNRQKGIGTAMVLQSLPVFFERLQLKVLYCEPYAHNPAPNQTLLKVGFEWLKTHTTIPGTLNFEQTVNRYRLTREDFEKINNSQ